MPGTRRTSRRAGGSETPTSTRCLASAPSNCCGARPRRGPPSSSPTRPGNRATPSRPGPGRRPSARPTATPGPPRGRWPGIRCLKGSKWCSRSGRRRLDGSLSPDLRQVDLDGVEGLGADLVVVLMSADDDPGGSLEAQDFQSPQNGIDEPGVPDAAPREDRQLADAVVPLGGGGEDLTDAIRNHLEGAAGRGLIPLSPPTGQIRDQ